MSVSYTKRQLQLRAEAHMDVLKERKPNLQIDEAIKRREKFIKELEFIKNDKIPQLVAKNGWIKTYHHNLKREGC